jgi:hypothetical protein
MSLPAIATILSDSSDHEHTLAGIVAYQRDRGLKAKIQSRVEVMLRPLLWELPLSTDNRVFQGWSFQISSPVC